LELMMIFSCFFHIYSYNLVYSKYHFENDEEFSKINRHLVKEVFNSYNCEFIYRDFDWINNYNQSLATSYHNLGQMFLNLNEKRESIKFFVSSLLILPDSYKLEKTYNLYFKKRFYYECNLLLELIREKFHNEEIFLKLYRTIQDFLKL